MPALAPEDLSARPTGESSQIVRHRVIKARAHQLARQGNPNAQLTPQQVETHALAEPQGMHLLKQATTRLNLSARGYHRLLKVARTIADLEGITTVNASHIAEALQYRQR